MSRNTKSVAARIDADSVAKIERAARYRGETKSAFLATVIENHIARNPNGLRAFRVQSVEGGEESDDEKSTDQPESFVDQILRDLE